MKGKIFIDSVGIVNWIPEDPTGDLEGTKLAMSVLEQLINEQKSSAILVDLSKSQRPNAHQRQIVVNALRVNISKIRKIAIFGQTPLMKAVSYFIINLSGYDMMRFFGSRAQATQWLLEK